jgi:PQQ-like domain
MSFVHSKRFGFVGSLAARVAMVAIGVMWMAGCTGVVTTTPNGPTGNGSTDRTAPTITTQPVNQVVSAGQSASFVVVATGIVPLSYQWQRNSVNVAGATTSSYTTPATTTADDGAKFDVVVSNSAGTVTSVIVSLTVSAATGGNPPPPPPVGSSTVDVTTYHYDNLRTGQNTHETILTHANVNATQFGLVGAIPVDGHVDAQPLLLSSLAIAGGTKNVLYVVTEHDSVYAFDADSVNGTSVTTLWHSSMLAAGETSSDDRGCGQVTPEIGITSTPVIDRTRNAIYVVAVSKTSGGKYIHRFHALDLTTGKELTGGPTVIAASVAGTGANSANGNVTFDPAQYNERPGLLQIGGTIFTTWGSHCDGGPYTSWVMAYSADTLKQSGVINMVPNGNEGGIWMAGAAPGADASGNIYFIIGNGDFGTSLDSDGFPANKNCGNCFAKISSTLPLAIKDYFTPLNTVQESNADTDFGSGGPLLLPDIVDSNGQTRHLAVGAGKDSIIYVVDRDNMGKFFSGKNNIYQQINGAVSGGVWSKPSYFNGVVYYGSVGDSIKAFPITGGKLATSASSRSSHSFGYPGATPVISANTASDGIVWVVENGNNGVLHAYDASNLATELYNSTQGSTGGFTGNKFVTPMVANGRVYVGTQTSVVVFGLK